MPKQRLYRHPLAALRAQMGLSAGEYLRLVDQRHRALGFGAMATRREKASRWDTGVSTPEHTAQLAMASLHGIPDAAVSELGWPHWLLLAFPNDNEVLYSPWTPAGTVNAAVASVQGGPVDRRGFLIACGGTLGAITTTYAATTPPELTSIGRRRLTQATLTRLDQRLDDLRHLDDVLGGGGLRQAATTEVQLLNQLANDSTYTTAVGRHLFASLAEAARIAGWFHFDAGMHAAAQSFYVTSLRAAATADDPLAGAHALIFMAIQSYTVGSPHDALNLAYTAQDQCRRRATPRMRCMAHMRAARALSKTGAHTECARELDAARTAYDHGPHDDDPPWSYWVTVGELEMLAGSCALDLSNPSRALRHFTAAHHTARYAADGYLRDNAIYLTRAAEAHFDLGDIDAACATAHEAHTQSTTVDSTRPTGALVTLRQRLAQHRSVPAVREFLDSTA